MSQSQEEALTSPMDVFSSAESLLFPPAGTTSQPQEHSQHSPVPAAAFGAEQEGNPKQPLPISE